MLFSNTKFVFVAFVLLAVTITLSGFAPFASGAFTSICVLAIGKALFSNPVFITVCNIVPVCSPTVYGINDLTLCSKTGFASSCQIFLVRIVFSTLTVLPSLDTYDPVNFILFILLKFDKSNTSSVTLLTGTSNIICVPLFSCLNAIVFVSMFTLSTASRFCSLFAILKFALVPFSPSISTFAFFK